MSELIGTPVQLAVCEVFVLRNKGNSLRATLDLSLKELVQAHLLRIPLLRSIPLHQ